MPDIPLVMPKMSMTMTEGEVVTWNRKEGDTVAAGEVVCEVLTDKVDMEVESPASGVLVRVSAAIGTTIAVGEPLAYIRSESDGLLDGLFGSPDSAAGTTGGTTAGTDIPDGAGDGGAQPAGTEVSDGAGDGGAQPVGSDLGGADQALTPVTATTTPPSRKAKIPALPGARRRAAELGVDLANLTGTGPDGAVSLTDVEAAGKPAELTPPAVTQAPTAGQQVAQPQPLQAQPVGKGQEQPVTPAQQPAAQAKPSQAMTSQATRSLTDTDSAAAGIDPDFSDALSAKRASIRAAVSRAMTASAAIPQFTAWIELDLSSLAALRNRISWTTVLLAAYSRALAAEPAFGGPGVGVALAVDTPVGLLAPVVGDADTASVAELDATIRALATSARSGRLTGAQLSGATTTFSNLGGWGVEEFNALITPGQSSALSAGAVIDRVVVKSGGLTVVPSCRVGLTVDHRDADGADAARVLQRLRQLTTQGAVELMNG